ncbi:hypothetical protein DASC09_003440 [Saccharomycopsis crataegensis]|uniref:Uncharacterized protein n=1 Tax=Saccharomycopsis crataegensis TaxID=43959 RepID=A0AAV5QED1_9ASCO|nr:hypothetical protein DASC09_003440 [Saccharomycopsis crataegensis]
MDQNSGIIIIWFGSTKSPEEAKNKSLKRTDTHSRHLDVGVTPCRLCWLVTQDYKRTDSAATYF